MPVSLSSSSSSALFIPSPQETTRCRSSVRSFQHSLIKSHRSFPRIRAGNASSVDTNLTTELDAVSSFSEIVPDTVIFDDFEKFPPTAATVSSSLILGICGLPDTKFRSAVETALADGECFTQEDSNLRMSCMFNKALVNVGADLTKLVPGRVSTEVDARLAYDTHAIIRKVHELLKFYNEVEVPPERLLFKIPSTWQGIEASRVLESEGIQTHLTFVYSFPQAAAAAQAGASVIQIFVGRIRDWARNHSGDLEIEAACKRGEDPGLTLRWLVNKVMDKHFGCLAVNELSKWGLGFLPLSCSCVDCAHNPIGEDPFEEQWREISYQFKVCGMEEALEIPIISDLTMILGSISQSKAIGVVINFTGHSTVYDNVKHVTSLAPRILVCMCESPCSCKVSAFNTFANHKILPFQCKCTGDI